MGTHKSFKVFLVDDDIFYLNLLQQIVRNVGLSDVNIFQNGTECLNTLEQKPDVIFLDHNMDVLTGLEVLKKIKRYDPDIFVVMVSAQEDLKTAVDSLKYGVFDYIIKGDNENSKVENVLRRIGAIKDAMKIKKPSFIQKLLSII